MSPDTQRLTTLEARQIINQINKMNLNIADYEYLKKLINKLILGISFSGYMPHKNGYRFYRGVKFEAKPMATNELQYPPKNLVTDFQRCNPPEKPMFYCSLSPLVVYKELNVAKGDVIYLSRWSIKNNFSFIPIGNLNADDDCDDRTAMILSFFETKFLTPVHQTYSSQYKVTSAITEVLSTGDINISADIFEFETNRCALAGVAYPSVADPHRRGNLALHPFIVDSCLSLDYVQEIKITEASDRFISINYTDFSSNFESKKIHWAGRDMVYELPPYSAYTFTKKQDDWIVRDRDGNVVIPI